MTNPPDVLEGSPVAASSGMTTVDVDSKFGACSSTRSGSRRKRKHSPDDIGSNAESLNGVADEFGNGAAVNDPVSDLYAVLEGSALLPFLASKLQANSFLEICSHASVYRCIINIVREIGEETESQQVAHFRYSVA